MNRCFDVQEYCWECPAVRWLSNRRRSSTRTGRGSTCSWRDKSSGSRKRRSHSSGTMRSSASGTGIESPTKTPPPTVPRLGPVRMTADSRYRPDPWPAGTGPRYSEHWSAATILSNHSSRNNRYQGNKQLLNNLLWRFLITSTSKSTAKAITIVAVNLHLTGKGKYWSSNEWFIRTEINFMQFWWRFIVFSGLRTCNRSN